MKCKIAFLRNIYGKQALQILKNSLKNLQKKGKKRSERYGNGK